MRSITAMLLLTSLLVLQYARQVTYWECRLANYYKAESQKCDCEKLVEKSVGQQEALPIPAVHNHFHLDESFYPSCMLSTKGIYITGIFSWPPATHIFIERIMPGRLDRPPQMG